MNGMWLIKLLRSTRLSAWVLGILTMIYFLGLIIPQKAILGGKGAAAFRESSPALYSFLDWLGFLEIYTSPITIVMLVLFFVNLFVVFTRRSRSIMARTGILVPESLPAGESAAEVSVGGVDDGELFQRIRAMLGRSVFRSEDGRFIAVRNRYAPFGLVLFHLSFFLILIGGLMLFYTRGEGTVALTEGEDFNGRNWTTLTPPIIGEPPEAMFSVMDIRPQYAENITVNMEVDIALYRTLKVGDFESQTISVNNPATRGPLSILVQEVGVSPLLRFRDKRGQTYEYAYVSLDVLTGKRDAMVVPHTSFRMEFEFFPDYAIINGVETSRSTRFANPVFHCYFFEGKRLVWEGNVRPGQTVDLGELNMHMEDLRLWAKLLVIKERGRIPLILGLALGTIGLVWRFFFNRLEVRGSREGGVLRFRVTGGQSRFTAEQLQDSLASKLQEYYPRGGPDASA